MLRPSKTRHALVHVTQIVYVEEAETRRIYVRVVLAEPSAGRRSDFHTSFKESTDNRVEHSWRVNQSHDGR